MDIELSSGVIAACTLLILWIFEAMLPGLHGQGAGAGQRVRHLLLGLLNAAVSAGVIVVLLGADFLAGDHGLGLLRLADAPVWAAVLIALLVLDAWQYACHVLLHKVPVLWRLHAVHHHADRLEATVAMRFHTCEVVIHGLSLVPLILLLGIGIESIAIYNLLLLPFSMFHHANIRLRPKLERVLRLFIVTPGMHCVHHSRWQPETDSNYSAILSIWDRLFGTLRTVERTESISIGLDGFREEEISTVTGMLSTPFSSSKSGMGHPPPGSQHASPENSDHPRLPKSTRTAPAT